MNAIKVDEIEVNEIDTLNSSESVAAPPAPAPLGNIQDFTLAALSQWFVARGEKPFRARQVFQWLYQRQVTGFGEMTDLSKPLRALLGENFRIGNLELAARRESADGSVKFALRLEDGKIVETVLMPNRTQYTVCVSSQVGCAMGCTFCATARMGLERNLSAGEIVAQVVAAARAITDNATADAVNNKAAIPSETAENAAENAAENVAENGAENATEYATERFIRNIVFMGMGEPLHNYDNLVTALEILQNDYGFGLSSRRITISTSGLAPAIRRYARDGIRANLAVSLNSVDDATRTALMPVNRRWNIADLLDACREIPSEKRYRITFEYVLIAGLTDALPQARKLVKLLHGFKCKVNLIPYNPFPGSPYAASSLDTALEFQKILLAKGLLATVRISKGQDIQAACGQLSTAVKAGYRPQIGQEKGL